MSRHKEDGSSASDIFAVSDKNSFPREETIEYLTNAIKNNTFDDFVFIGFPSDRSSESIDNLACLVAPGQKMFSATRLCALLAQLGALFLRRSGVYDALTYKPTDEKAKEAVELFSQLIAEISVTFRGLATSQTTVLLPNDELRAELHRETERLASEYDFSDNPPTLLLAAEKAAKVHTDPINKQMRIRNMNSAKNVDVMNNWKEFLK